jgi:hypothetical protein
MGKLLTALHQTPGRIVSNGSRDEEAGSNSIKGRTMTPAAAHDIARMICPMVRSTFLSESAEDMLQLEMAGHHAGRVGTTGKFMTGFAAV